MTTARPGWKRWLLRGTLLLAGLLVIAVAAAFGYARREVHLATVALGHRDFAGAGGHARAALGIWPWQADAYLLAAEAARGEGRVAAAEDYLLQAERHGADAEAVTLQGYLIELRRGELTPRLEELLWHRIDTDSPWTDRLLEGLGQAYLYTYRLGEAGVCADRWAERQPDSAPALYLRGLVRESLQSLDAAGEDYRAAHALDPANRLVRWRLAEWCLTRHLSAEAVGHFQQLVEREPDKPAYRLGLARAWLQLAEYEQARPLLDALLAEDGCPPLAVLERARLAAATRRFDDAERYYRQALAGDPSSAEAARALSQVLARNGKAAEGERLRAKADEIEAEVARLHVLLEKLGQKPEDVESRYEAAMICLKRGHRQEARRWLLSILRLRPDHRPSRAALAECP